MKICTKCWVEKEEVLFNKNKIQKDWLHSNCKECRALLNKKRRVLKWPELDKQFKERYALWKWRDYKKENAEKISEYQKRYREYYKTL